jgi:hypothetical protein
MQKAMMNEMPFLVRADKVEVRTRLTGGMCSGEMFSTFTGHTLQFTNAADH